MSGIIQHASYALHDREVHSFGDSIWLRSVGRSGFLWDPFWFQVVWKHLAGILTSSISTKSLHLPARLLFSKCLPLFEYLQGFRLVRQYLLIHMPHGIIDEEKHILTSSNCCFKGTASVQVPELQWLCGAGGRGSEGFSRQFVFYARFAIGLPGHFRTIGDHRQHLQSFETNGGKAAVP